MVRIPVDSSNLLEVGWQDGTLEVAFKDKSGNLTSVYDYQDVSQSVFNDLLSADSKGKFFAQFVKTQYPFTKVG